MLYLNHIQNLPYWSWMMRPITMACREGTEGWVRAMHSHSQAWSIPAPGSKISTRSALQFTLHWENYIYISFQIEWNMIVVPVFLSILNQMEFHLVRNGKENSHHGHIPFHLKGNIVSSVYGVHQRQISTKAGRDGVCQNYICIVFWN